MYVEDENGVSKSEKPKVIKDYKLGVCKDSKDEVLDKYRKSFDEGSLNFHLVPNQEKRNMKLIKDLREKFKEIAEGESFEFKGKCVGGNTEYTRGHRYIQLNSEESNGDEKATYINLIEMQTLTCDDNVINCYLDRIQFIKYRKSDKTAPNFIDENKKLIMMYPSYSSDSCTYNYNSNKEIYVYNTDLILKEENFQAIVDLALEFIFNVNKFIENK